MVGTQVNIGEVRSRTAQTFEIAKPATPHRANALRLIFRIERRATKGNKETNASCGERNLFAVPSCYNCLIWSVIHEIFLERYGR
jgi:hypothetical protein